MSVDDDVNSIAENIMEYLRRRPTASDSLDGVTNWWLMQQTIEKNRKLVEQALEQLAQEGKVAKQRNVKDETIYSLKRDNQSKNG